MIGADKARMLLTRYRHVFVILGFILIGQVILVLRLALISENFISPQTSSQPHSNNPQRDVRKEHEKSDPKYSKLHKSGPHPGAVMETNVPSPSSIFLEGLNVHPTCQVVGKDAISAIRRATTPYCKEVLANMTCLIATDTLYPKRLPRFCKRGDTTYMKQVGCFQDDKTNRLLSGSYTLLKATNSPQNCVDTCLQSGFPYAGVQYSVECFCGNNKPSIPTISDPALCNMKCPLTSNDDITCGGYFVIDVYETGAYRESESEANQGVIDYRHASKELIAELSKNGVARIVFFLTLNGRALRQVIRLVKSLFHERHFFYIHVDARQDYMFRELLAIEYKLPGNVRFMRKRLSTIWGGASLLKILMSGMEELVLKREELNWNWDYVINLSESDFPLKTITELETFLTLNKGKNFLKSHGRDVQNFIMKQGLDKTFVECEHRMWRIGDRKLPAGIIMDGGSDWIALHKDFVKYIVTTKDDLVNGLLKIFDHTLLPAESFFHIVLRNSEMCDTFVDNNLHVTNWKRKLGCKCQYKNIVDWCGCSPNDFRLADWSRLQETQAKLLFFGRKFEAVVSQSVINRLESHLYPDRSDSHYPTLNSYWQSIYHIHDLTPKADDAFLTLGASLSRIAANNFYEELLNTKYGLDVEVGNIGVGTKFEELSVFVQNDRISGILTRYEMSIGDSLRLSAESWYKLQNFATFEPWSDEIDKYHSKIQHIQVGRDYDQKEQIFRNFAGSIGPLSEPTLAYHVYADEALNLTFVWINSLQTVQAVQNFTIEIGITANFAKPVLKLPLTPGNWTVKVLSDSGHLVAQTTFMVSMAEFYHGQPITQSQNKILNGLALGKKEVPDDSDGQYWTPKALHSFIDEEIHRFYKLQATCLSFGKGELENQILASLNIVDDRGERNLNMDSSIFSNWNSCADTPWSTAFPDPKATITGIDPTTGMLLP